MREPRTDFRRYRTTTSGSMTFGITPEAFSRFFRAMLVGPPPRAKTADEGRWEDDGGALNYDLEPWSHEFVSAP